MRLWVTLIDTAKIKSFTRSWNTYYFANAAVTDHQYKAV